MSDLLADSDLAPVLAALPRARLVGGCVRDWLAGVAVADVDVATPDVPEVVVRRLEAAGLRVVPTGISHGTVTALSGGRPFEVTTLRRDVETDGRHAVVAWTDDWEEDAARRDFTINAMSMDRSGAVFDYFGGRDDLARGCVRFVGVATERIAEDRLRMLRFFRFFARYGRGAPDGEAVAAIGAAASEVGLLSVERVWSELRRILAVPAPLEAILLMERLGVLAAVLPEGFGTEGLARLMAGGAPADPLLRLASLLAGDVDLVADRLRLSLAERARLSALKAGPVPSLADDEPGLRRLLADDPAEILVDRTWLAGGFGPAWDALRAWLLAEPRPVFPLEGRDLLATGASPGPEIGRILREVRAWWLAGGCAAGRDACRARALGA